MTKPTITTLEKIANTLGVSVIDQLSETVGLDRHEGGAFLIDDGDATAALTVVGAAVRIALATESGGIDVTICTRLPTANWPDSVISATGLVLLR